MRRTEMVILTAVQSNGHGFAVSERDGADLFVPPYVMRSGEFTKSDINTRLLVWTVPNDEAEGRRKVAVVLERLSEHAPDRPLPRTADLARKLAGIVEAFDDVAAAIESVIPELDVAPAPQPTIERTVP